MGQAAGEIRHVEPEAVLEVLLAEEPAGETGALAAVEGVDGRQLRKELDEKGMSIVGTSPDAHIVEMIEIAGHPFFVGTQGHPEFKSRPNHAHPLFRGFVQAAVDKKTAEEAAMKG